MLPVAHGDGLLESRQYFLRVAAVRATFAAVLHKLSDTRGPTV